MKLKSIARRLSNIKGKLVGIGVFLSLFYVIGVVADLSTLSENTTFSKFFKWLSQTTVPLWIIFVILFGLSMFFLFKPAKLEGHSNEPISLLSEEQFMRYLQQALFDAEQECFFCFLGKNWVFTLFLTTVMVRIRGVKITVLYDSSIKHERYHLLNLIGCRIVPCKFTGTAPPFVGALFDPDDTIRGLVFTSSIKPKDGVFARRHACPHDYYSVSACRVRVDEIVKKAGNPPAEYATFTPKIISMTTEDIVGLIRKGRWYENAHITIEDIEIEKTRPIAKIVERVKVNQAKKVIQFFNQKSWPLFEPAAVVLANKKESSIIPPVLEENEDGTFTVIEGHSRIFSLRDFGKKKVKAVVVRGVEVETPDSPGKWSRIALRDQKQPVGRADLARRVDSYTHRGVWV